MATTIATTLSQTYDFQHPTLGSMVGLISPETPDIVQFRAIPYATLSGRFKQSVLRENLGDRSRDFTKPGYACPHTFDESDPHCGGPNPGERLMETSEFECLILEVNVPKLCLERMKLLKDEQEETLPVLNYIHGGGFVLGKIDTKHNTAYMAQHALTISKPVIATAFQYRLGALGFMATPEGENSFALWDQKNALLWIQKFIGGFGGDKRRVTVFGESAGGASICCHMLSHPPPSGPLFNRVINMSGVLGPMMMPPTQRETGTAFEEICRDLGIQEQGEAALEKLRALDVKTLVSASDAWVVRGNFWSPVRDSSFFREKVTWDQVPRLLGECDWVDEIIVGTTGFEGAANSRVANMMTPQSFQAHLRQQMDDEAASKVMRAYGISPDMDRNLFLTPAMRFLGDIIFDAPIHALTQHISTHTKKPIYRYVFDIRNPFPNAPFYQQAHHWVDVYFIFRSMQFRMPHQYLKDISDRHAALWIEFANGQKPWSEFKHDQGVIMVADEREGWVEKTMAEYEDMSKVRWDRLEVLWETWSENKRENWAPLDMLAVEQSGL